MAKLSKLYTEAKRAKRRAYMRDYMRKRLEDANEREKHRQRCQKYREDDNNKAKIKHSRRAYYLRTGR